MVSYVRMFHISPEADGFGKIFPHTLVFPYAFFTVLDKFLKTVLFNLLLAVKSEEFFNFKLDRQTVSIPTGFARYHIPFHRTVAGYHIFYNAGQNVTYMRFTVCCRGSVVKNIRLTLCAGINTGLEYFFFFPEVFDFLFLFHKIKIRFDILVHNLLLYELKNNPVHNRTGINR